MPRRIAVSSLNASTIDILNTIRANASTQYQNLVPSVSSYEEIPKVGETLFGYPALSNEFVNALVNRIALVVMKSMLFNNPYERLKKGYLLYGEQIEEIFNDLVKPLDYSPEKAEARENKRYVPNTKAAFHAINWRVLYPVSIQAKDLKLAFLSEEGVRSMIDDIIRQVYQSATYDEWLLFKYLLIKKVSAGAMQPIAIDPTNIKDAAAKFRGTSNLFTFPSTKYTESGVRNVAPREKQVIFMDSTFNAEYDVEVLSAAFNMDKAEYMGSLFLVDDFTSFDNERFDVIRSQSDMIEAVTPEELALMADVKAILLDEDWFQIYDNEFVMEDHKVASGLYWNYFLHTWKTISASPFANAAVFVESSALGVPESFTATVSGVDNFQGSENLIITLKTANDKVRFIQVADAVENGIAIHPYGAIIVPNVGSGEANASTSMSLLAAIGNQLYQSSAAVTFTSLTLGSTITFNKYSDEYYYL